MSRPSFAKNGNKLNQNGFTVTELVIAVSLLAALIVLVFGFMVNGIVEYTTATNRANLLNSARNGLEVITNDVRLSANADENNRWFDENGPDGEEFGWESNESTLVLANVAEDNSKNILFADAAEYIPHKNNVIYFLRDGTLYKRVLAAPVEGNSAITTCPAADASTECPADRILLENVQDFTIQYLNETDEETEPTNARSVRMTAALHKEAFGRPVDVTYTTRMVFRND